jgi:hypothetical protein
MAALTLRVHERLRASQFVNLMCKNVANNHDWHSVAAHNTRKNGLYGKDNAEQGVTCMTRGLVHVGSRCRYRYRQLRDMVDQ